MEIRIEEVENGYIVSEEDGYRYIISDPEDVLSLVSDMINDVREKDYEENK